MINHLGQPIGPALVGWVAPPAPPLITLEGRFCTLVALDPAAHSAALGAAFAEDTTGAIWTYLADGPRADPAAIAAWLETRRDATDLLTYTILVGGEALGLASYMRIFPQHGSIEVGGITYAPRLQRRPAATEAMYLMMRHAFELGYRRYEWKCDSLNAPSRAAAERLGFRYEGTFRNAMVYKGRSRDTAWFSIIDQEWPRLRAAFEAWLAPENFDASGAQIRRLAEFQAAPRS